MAPRKSSLSGKDSTANIGFEAKLWLAADKLRNNMDAGEYKHVVLGLVFLKYISDSFEEHHEKLLSGQGDYRGANPEDPQTNTGPRTSSGCLRWRGGPSCRPRRNCPAWESSSTRRWSPSSATTRV